MGPKVDLDVLETRNIACLHRNSTPGPSSQYSSPSFPKLFAREPLLDSKNKHGSLHHYSRKYTVSGSYVFKIKHLYLRHDFRKLLMPVA